MIRRRTAALAVAAALLLAGPASAAAAEPIWRLEQPPPPAGSPFTVPLGTPGDLQFWAPNRGLLTVAGNSTIARGIYSWNGQSWHQLATVCGGAGDSSKIAWAGPDEFWVVTEPSPPRAGAGLGLCRFKGGQVVGSWSTRIDSADPFRQLLSATCNGPGDCWFGGVGSQDALGERVGAFHLHWDGSDLHSVYGPQGRGVTDMEFSGGQLYETTLVGRSPENRSEAVELAQPEPQPRLIHRVGAGFANDPFGPAPLPGVPGDGTELLALDGDGGNLWAVGGGGASGPSAPIGSSVARPPLAARLVGGAFQELSLSGAAFGPNDRFTDVAALPGSGAAMATVVPFADRGSTNSKAMVARIEADGATATTRLPSSGAGRGSAARIACPAANECWLVTWGGWLFHYTRRDAAAGRHRPGLPGHDHLPPQRGGRTVHPRRPARRRLAAVRPGAGRTRKGKGRTGDEAAAAAAEEGQVRPARAAADGQLHGHPQGPGAAAGQARRPHRRQLAEAGLRAWPARAHPAAEPRALPDQARLRDQGDREVTRVRRNRRRLAAAALTFALTLAAAALLASAGSSAPAPPGTGPLPLLGSADTGMTLMGSAPGGLPGEAWGYRQLPADVGAVSVGSQALPFGPPLDPANPGKQLALLRYTEGQAAGRSSRPPATATATPTAARSRTRSRRGSPAPAAASWSAATPAARPTTRWSSSITTPAAPGRRWRPRRRRSCCRPKANGRPRRWPAIAAPARSPSPPSRKRAGGPASSSVRPAAPPPTGSSTSTAPSGAASR